MSEPDEKDAAPSAPDTDTSSPTGNTLTRGPGGRFVSAAEAADETTADEPPPRPLAERLPIRAVSELLELLTLVETYRNPQTRYLFRQLAKQAGYEIGGADPERPHMYTPGDLEALISAHCAAPTVTS